VLALLVLLGCGAPKPPVRPTAYNPARDLGPMFHQIQMSGIFPDSKTFVDARPLMDPAEIVQHFDGANLKAFVAEHFELPKPVAEGFHTDSSQTMEQHIAALWPVLTRQPDSADPRSSLIPLPHPYVVPGGRFREVYYWDSYFTMLGLVRSGRADLVRDMLDNFAYLIQTVGHIPNGNRTYYLSRSQPPFFGAMVGLYAQATDTAQALRYLDALEVEYKFWMDGAERLGAAQVYRRVVRLPNGPILNRYWDDLAEPRPEAYRPDYEIAETLPDEQREAFYRNAKATAESGWDFSSRWMRDPKDLRTLETTEIIPIDLNSLLYNTERTIAALRAFRHQPGDSARLVANSGDSLERAIRIGFLRDLAIGSGVTEDDAVLAVHPRQRLPIAVVVAFHVSDGNLQYLALLQIVRKRRAGALNPQMYLLAHILQSSIAHQGAGKQAGLA